MNRQDKNLSSSSTHPRTPRRATLSVIAAATALTLALVLSACGGGSSTTGAAGGTSGSSSSSSSGNVAGAEAATVSDTTGTPKQGGTINYAHEQETPCLTGGWVQEAFIERQYADELVSQTKTGKIVPWLATSWDTSKDGLTWTFHLKPGVKFTNGEPLDAKAVVKNFEYWSDPSNGNGVAPFLHNYYKSSKALDATTVQVTLSKPYAPLLSSISQGYDGILAPATYAGGPETICNEPIGSGPWIIDKWTHGQNITFSRNPNYNSAPSNALHQGPAYAEKTDLELRRRPDHPVRLADHRPVERDLRRPRNRLGRGAGKLRSAAVHHPGPTGHPRPQHASGTVRRTPGARSVRLRRRS